jgi:TolB-like protein/tetratricopeptide (TPR) repeat protein
MDPSFVARHIGPATEHIGGFSDRQVQCHGTGTVTDVFISYQRGSEAVARRVAERLRAAGLAVWFDEDLPPNRSFADVIVERLESAKAVFVLWSELAARSEWVRAEADYARQHHKLVQASVDGCIPPMPFNQIQCASLKGWGGEDDDHDWKKIAEAVSSLVGAELATPVLVQTAGSRPTPRFSLRRGSATLIAGALVVAFGLVVWLLHDRLPGSRPAPALRAAILPFQVESQASSARYFADSLTDQLQNSLSNSQIQVVSRADADTLNSGDRGAKIKQLGVRLLFDGAVQDDGATTDVSVHLDDTDNHVTLWSGHFTAPSAQSASLRAHIGAVVVGVLTCSARALRPDDGLSDPQVLIQYLIACDRFAQQGEDDQQMTNQMVSALREVTTHAPSFPPAHSALAKFLAYTAAVVPPEQAAAFRTEAGAEAKRALELDPKDADAYVALELLQPAANWAKREELLRKGLAADPDWSHANGFLGQVLNEVGRVEEAVVYARRAAAVDPLGESWAGVEVAMLAGAGKSQEAAADASQLTKSWPNSKGDWLDRVIGSLRATDWDGMLTNLDEPVAASALPPEALNDLRMFALAAKSRNPDLMAKARNALLGSAKVGPAYATTSITGLSALGYLDDAFRLAQTYQPGLALTGANSEFLFTTATAPMRRDPRFMQLAERIGLLSYWRSTGKWPDFCRDPSLPYHCH